MHSDLIALGIKLFAEGLLDYLHFSCCFAQRCARTAQSKASKSCFWMKMSFNGNFAAVNKTLQAVCFLIMFTTKHSKNYKNMKSSGCWGRMFIYDVPWSTDANTLKISLTQRDGHPMAYQNKFVKIFGHLFLQICLYDTPNRFNFVLNWKQKHGFRGKKGGQHV